MARPKLPEIEKVQKRVRKRYPGSICVRDSYGKYYIEWNEENLNDTFLLDNCDTELMQVNCIVLLDLFLDFGCSIMYFMVAILLHLVAKYIKVK